MALDDQTASHDIPGYNGNFKFKCNVCVDVFFDCNYCFKNHKQLHCTKIVYISFGKVFYKCNVCCDLYFECKHCLNVHKMQLHNVDNSKFKMCDTCSQMYADKCDSYLNQQKIRKQFDNVLYSKIENVHLLFDCLFVVGFIAMVYLFYLSNPFLYV